MRWPRSVAKSTSIIPWTGDALVPGVFLNLGDANAAFKLAQMSLVLMSLMVSV